MSLNIEFCNPNQGKNQVYVRKLVKSIRNYYLSVLIGIGVCLNQLKIGCVVWFIEFRNWDEKDPFIELGGNMYDFWKLILAFLKQICQTVLYRRTVCQIFSFHPIWSIFLIP